MVQIVKGGVVRQALLRDLPYFKADGWGVDLDGDLVADSSVSVSSGLAGGRALAALNGPRNIAYAGSPATTQQGYRSQHTVPVGASDLRLVWTGPASSESDISNSVYIETWAIFPNGATPLQLTYGGKKVGQLDPGGALMSEPFAADMVAGSVFYTESWVTATFGASTTLAASSSIGATSISVTAAPPATMPYPFDLVVDSGGNKEIVPVASVSGSGPYTYTFTSGFTAAKAHSSAVVAGQEITGNQQILSDRLEGLVSTRAACVAGTYTSLGTSPVAILASSSIGDDRVTVATLPTIPPSGTMTLDTAGQAEAVTVKNVLGTANPFTYIFTSPLTKTHNSGVNLIGSGANSGFAPFIVADRLATEPKPVLIVGDSIPSGQGNTGAVAQSFLTVALEAANRPYVMISKGAETAQVFAALASSYRRRRLLTLAPVNSWAVYQYGTNDVYASRSLVNLQADTTTIITALKARSLKVAVTTLIPRTTSSDAWATTGNQTLAAQEAVRLTYNTWVRAGAGGLADLVIDTAAAVDSGLMTGGAETGLWGIETNSALTQDGIHPTRRGHVLMAAAVNVALLA